MTNDTPQPNENKRRQTSSNATLIVRFFRLFRGGRAAHNGLVGGSSPPGPTTQSCPNGHFHRGRRIVPRLAGFFTPSRSPKRPVGPYSVLHRLRSLRPRNSVSWETEIGWWRLGSNVAITARSGRACDTGGTIRRAVRKAAPRPCHAGGARRSLP